MKYLFPISGLAIFLLFILSAPSLSAQESGTNGSADLLENNIDSLFDEPVIKEDTKIEPKSESTKTTLLEDVKKKRGLSFAADYNFVAGYSPGWSEAPWFWSGKDETFSQSFAGNMTSTLSLNFQISSSLSIKQSFIVSFPDFVPKIGEFYCDYTLLDKAFFRIGQHNVNWGLSPNFPYTNLPARIPYGNAGGDAYALKADIPVGIGGLQFLALTRSGFIDNPDNPQIDELGYGIKYNLALQKADINIGAFFHRQMPFRGYFSIKSTLFEKTEVYAEGLAALDQDSFDNPVFAGNIGFFDDYFGKRLTVNGEYFYNGESYSSSVQTSTGLIEEDIIPFIYGHNAALNLLVRPKPGSLSLFARFLYNFNEESGQLVPGLTLSPLENLTIYLAFPMALGSPGGTYYSSNMDINNRPFGIALVVSIGGGYQKGWYE